LELFVLLWFDVVSTVKCPVGCPTWLMYTLVSVSLHSRSDEHKQCKTSIGFKQTFIQSTWFGTNKEINTNFARTIPSQKTQLQERKDKYITQIQFNQTQNHSVN
jgi:hypothetical protein